MIAFSCKCGKTLRVKDEAAGKRVRCPACSQVVAVPGSSAQGAAAGSPALCPNCHVGLPPGAVLCTTCGLDLRTGKTVVGRRSLRERIPWGIIRSVGSIVLLVALLVGVVWLVKGALSRPGPSADKGKGAEGKGTAAPQAPVRVLPPAPFVRVRCVTKGPETALPEGLSFKGEDAEYSAKKLADLLVARVTREAADALSLAGHKVPAKAEGRPASGEELTLLLDLELAWACQERDGRREPKALWVTKAAARLMRPNGVAFWKAGQPYVGLRPALQVRPEDVERLAAAKRIRTEVDYDKQADQVASAVARIVLAEVPAAGVVNDRLATEREAEQAAKEAIAEFDSGKADEAKAAKLISEGNPYLLAELSKRVERVTEPALLVALAEKSPDRKVVARATEIYVKTVGTGPKASETANALEHPELMLAGPLRASFTKASGAFAAELPLLSATARRAPYVALTFARVAERLEKDAAIKKALGKLCAELTGRNPPPTVGTNEIRILGEVADAEPATALGRTALLTLLDTGGFGVEVPAATYLFKVAAGILPDLADPWEDGSFRLSDEQMAMLSGITRHRAPVADVVAVALLLRVGGTQREEVRKLIAQIHMGDAQVLAALSELQSDDPTKVRNAVLHGMPHDTKARGAAPLMADAYFKSKEPSLRATMLYGLFCSSGEHDPYKWALVHMLESPDLVERRAAAAAFARLGGLNMYTVSDLQAVLPKQTDAQTRRSLESAIAQGLATMRAANAFVEGGPPK